MGAPTFILLKLLLLPASIAVWAGCGSALKAVGAGALAGLVYHGALARLVAWARDPGPEGGRAT